MAAQGEATLPATRRTRKSIGGGSSSRRTLDKENATLDVGGAVAASKKKSRSKSIGPGGLDALKTANGNRRASLAVPPPRSILKPTMPLLPDIPSYKPKQAPGGSGAANDAGGTKVALRTEEEQQAAAREREERERARLEKEIKDRRDARRKSLANRRVSFAAEATLHTFHEIDEMQDSTTSTDSTRRASSAQQQHQHDAGSDPPSTPPDDADDLAAESPADQSGPQRRRRRSSAASSMYGSDDTVGSVYDSDFDHADSVAEIQAIEMEGSSDEDGTIMTVEAEEMTSASIASPRSAFDSDSTGSLDENLRLAARMAVTQNIDEDEEVIAGFAGWGRKNHSQENPGHDPPKESHTGGDAGDQDSEMDMDTDMDMTTARGGILYPELPSPDKDDEIDEDMSMDVTTALGGILSKAKAFLRRKSANPGSQPEPTELGEQTMEFTTAVGGIQPGVSDASHIDIDGNEDMSMEFTAAVGGLLSGSFSKNDPQANRPSTTAGDDDDGGDLMDMTVAVGRILPETEEQDQTMGMDMTVAVGGILQSASTPEARSAARKIMELEADEPGHTAAVMERVASQKRALAGENADRESSPFHGRGLRRTPPRGLSPAARSPAQPSSSPMRHTPTPSPQRNTAPARSPARTPPADLGSQSSSPMRNLSSPVKTTPRSPVRLKLFHQDPNTGLSTPRVVLTPQGRRLSGVGADRPGLGSPRVAEIFDRRESIGEAASSFVPSEPANPRRNVAFADPRELEAEVDRERRDEADKEREASGSQDDRDGTLNLMEMIQGLSPKKNPLRGRKSLHVGSARGLLGKRPAELDDDDDDDDSEVHDSVKRLKGHQGSPVKNIRLQSPPTKAETTTGRKTRPSIRPAEPTDAFGTPTVPSSPQRATTRRLFSAADEQPTATADLDRTVPADEAEAPPDDGGERIHLQDFLNMTSIRFMELTTTKRRHTVAPGAPRESTAAGTKDDLSFERCVVAGACTVPVLEMYQHSCRELKKYISEGRRIVREIETETFEENPPLFREYMTASPEFKVLMDNQFKNVKTHARLLSKAMWYEWRMKLQDGLKEGLVRTAEGMDSDDKLLAKQQALLSSVLPGLVEQFEALEAEQANLEAVERELADCDPQDLEDARAELAAADKAIAEKTKRLEDLRRELDESTEGVEALARQKQQCLDEIREADRIREECRGWSTEEVTKLKAQTDAIEKQTGWSLASVSGTAIALRYRREIELTFDVAALQHPRPASSSSPSSPIDIRYIADPPARCPPEKTFILRRLRAHLRQQTPFATTITPPAKRPRHLLRLVADAWDEAEAVSAHVRRLNLTFPTVVTLHGEDGDGADGGGDGDGCAATVASSVLLVPLQTRVEVRLRLDLAVRDAAELEETEGTGRRAVEVCVAPEAGVVYGEPFGAGKMVEFLAGRVGSVTGSGGSGGSREGGMGWDEAVLELYRRLLAKGRAR